MTDAENKYKSIVPVAVILVIVLIAALLWAVSNTKTSDNKPIVKEQIPEPLNIQKQFTEAEQNKIIEQQIHKEHQAYQYEKTTTEIPILEETAEQPIQSDIQNPAVPAKSLKEIVNQARTWAPVYQYWTGKEAPDFVLADITGKNHRLSDYKGKNILLIFWATWCPPCRAEIPDLIKLRNIFGEDELVILAASDEKPSKVKTFVSSAGINYTVLLDTGNMPPPYGLQRAYRAVGVPCSFFIDNEGKIKLAASGTVPMRDIVDIFRAVN